MLESLATTTRRSPALLTALSLLLAGPGWSQNPFDITDPAPRSVVVFVDDNSSNPASVGLNLVEAYTGSWSVDAGGVGVITVSGQDAFDAAVAATDLQGTPVRPGDWTPVVYRIDRTTGDVLSLTAGGWVNDSLQGDLPFGAELNTLNLDPTPILFCGNAIPYGTSGFSDFDLGGGSILGNAWCTDVADIFFRPGGCPLNGPAPFPYNPATGRVNAIGPVMVFSAGPGDLCIGFPIFATFGDVQLFEVSLGLSMAATPSPVQTGGTLTYAITASNSSPGSLTGVVISDVLPPNTAFLSASDGGTETAGVVTWPTFAMSPSQVVVR